MKVFIALSVATLALPAAATAGPGVAMHAHAMARPMGMNEAWHGTVVNSNFGRGGTAGAGYQAPSWSKPPARTTRPSTATKPTAGQSAATPDVKLDTGAASTEPPL
jgi:hypothetical protein